MMIEPTVAQTTPGGQATSPLTYVVLAGLAVWLVQRRTDVDLLGPLRGIVGGGSNAGDASNSRPGFGLSRPRTLAIIGFGLFAVGSLTGLLGLSPGAQTPVAAVSVLLATYLTLRGLGAYSFGLFAAVAAGVVLLALSALGEPIIGPIVNNRIFPLLAVGGLYLGYQAIQAYRRNQRETVVVRRIRRGGGD